MNGLMMDYQLTLPTILHRAEQLYGHKEVVTRLPDKSFHRYTYADFVRRTKKLVVALQKLGVQSGDRVATLCWNHYQHLEAYFGIPTSGAVLHTLNLRLSPDDLAYIAGDAEDKVILVDKSLVPLLEKFRDRISAQHFVVISQDGDIPEGYLSYEKLLDEADETSFTYPDFNENQAAAMCYTSGTTGRPKGVLYSHRSQFLHSLATATVDVMGIAERDVVLPVVPMFHANAWGIPFAAVMVGATQVFPGPFLDPESLLEDFEREKVTLTAGVPTIWLGIVQMLEKNPANRWQLTPGMRMVVGGSAAPEAIIRRFDEFNLRIIHAWGMTEMSPLGTIANLPSDLQAASADTQYAYRAQQGTPAPLVEIRAFNDNGEVPWDSQSMGELEVRGPFIAAAYFHVPDSGDRFSADGWFRTGDIVSIDARGCIKIQDRAKDLIKSGGEWISSVDLENALVGHPAVAEAAVIAIPHPKWAERPLGIVVLKEGQQVTEVELLEFIAPKFAKWSLPDQIVFTDSIPHTATGKILKTALRQQHKGATENASVS